MKFLKIKHFIMVLYNDVRINIFSLLKKEDYIFIGASWIKSSIRNCLNSGKNLEKRKNQSNNNSRGFLPL